VSKQYRVHQQPDFGPQHIKNDMELICVDIQTVHLFWIDQREMKQQQVMTIFVIDGEWQVITFFETKQHFTYAELGLEPFDDGTWHSYNHLELDKEEG